MGRVWGFRTAEPRFIEAQLDGLIAPVRVVQLTDLHFGMVTPQKLIARAVRTANEQEPDLVVLTGDFVCRGRRWISQIADTLAPLKAPAIAVLGNHDHWVASDAVRRALERAGITVLQNAWTSVELGAQVLHVAGMDDSTTKNHDIQATLAGLPEGPVLGLTHNPAAAPILWSAGVGGVLSGHTHAGQMYVRGLTRPLYASLLEMPYVDGMYEDAAGWVYVSAGVGAGAFPFRAGQPAQREVTVLDLLPERG